MLLTNNAKNLSILLNELSSLESEFSKVVCKSIESIDSGNKLMFCGNGGSASDSQHLSAEFVGRFVKDRKPLPAISLTTDTSCLTCVSNDYSFDEVFSRQVHAIGQKGDVLFVISTSGNSRNLLSAAKAAKDNGIFVVGLLGNDGGLLSAICDVNLVVKSQVTARIQEAHILIGHSLCQAIESKYLN